MPKCQTKIFMPNALKKRQIWAIWHEKRQYGNPDLCTRFEARPDSNWENAEKFIKDLKGAWLNGGVQIEQRN